NAAFSSRLKGLKKMPAAIPTRKPPAAIAPDRTPPWGVGPNQMATPKRKMTMTPSQPTTKANLIRQKTMLHHPFMPSNAEVQKYLAERMSRDAKSGDSYWYYAG